MIFSQLGPNRRWIIHREYMGNRVLLHEFAEAVLEISAAHFPKAKFVDVGDPAGGQHGDKDERTSIDILKEKGVEVLTRRVGKRKIIEGIDQRLAMRLRGEGGDRFPAIEISRRGAPILLGGFAGGYAFPKGKDGKIRREEPLEDGWYEHPHDALQYAYVHLFLGSGGDGLWKQIVTPSWRIR